MTPAFVGVSHNPLAPIVRKEMRTAVAGGPLRQYKPHEGAFMCRLNGSWVLPESWDWPVRPGDVVEWYEVPQGGDGNLRTILQIVVTIVGALYGIPPIVTMAVNMAIGYAMAPDAPVEAEQSAIATTYTTGLAGNRAKPFDPIPVICGRHMSFPPFACQPYYGYSEYGTDSEGKEIGGDQFYYALYAVGIGEHRVERAQFDDTSVTHYSDVLTARYLKPGERPTTVNANMVTAPEVVGQEMLPSVAIGGFVTVGAYRTTKSLQYDIFMPRGLGKVANDGTMQDHTVMWRVEVREVDEFGVAITPWEVVDSKSVTAATRQARRFMYKIELPEAIRAEVRIIRLDVMENNDRFLNTVAWGGLRAVVEQAVPLNPNTAHYELVLRASEQLSQVTQNRFNLISWALIETVQSIDSDGVITWTDPVETRLAADWMIECARSEVWGLGMSLDRIDVQSFVDLRATSIARQDRFDYVFDASMDAWSALQMMARTARARVFRRGGVLTVARDEWDTMPVTAFTHTNSFDMRTDERLPTLETEDGLIVEYFDNRAWEWLTVDCPAPGVTSMTRPRRQRVAGITGPIHAKREGLYEAAQNALRTRITSCRTEMEGVLPAYMSAVRWLPDIPGYGQTGDVVDFDPAANVLTLADVPQWVPGSTMVIAVRKPDGAYTDPTPIAQSDDPYKAQLLAPLPGGFVPTGFNLGTEERPTYVLGVLGGMDEIVKITGIADGGKGEQGEQLFQISGVIDDIRVHQADNDYLPAPGEIQDPIDPADEADGGGGGEVITVPRLDSTNWALSDAAYKVGYEFRADGTLWTARVPFVWDPFPNRPDYQLPNQWVLRPPIELTEAERYEVMFTYSIVFSSEGGPIGGGSQTLIEPYVEGATGVWLPLSQTQRFMGVIDNLPNHPGDNFFYGARWLFRFQIRDKVSGQIQADATYLTENVMITGGS